LHLSQGTIADRLIGMLQTYKAILRGDHIEWLGQPPENPDPVKVHITFLEEAASEAVLERGRVMAEALATLAGRGSFAKISDPMAWQRETRSERNLPIREP
jgi:hypothetical protein